MKKIGILFDSTCGFTYEQAKEMGMGFIPMIVNVNGKDYEAGKDLHQEDLYAMMENRDTIIKTSLPSAKLIEEAIEDSLKNYEQVVYVGMSHKLSGTNNAVRLFVEQNEQYKDRVKVFESEFSSPWMPLYAKELVDLVDKYDDIDQLINDLKKCHKYMTGYLSPGDIWWFYKGGRITKLQYMIGNIAKIVPILKVADGEIKKDQTAKARGIEKAMHKMVDLIKEELEILKLPRDFFKYVILNTGNEELYRKSIEVMCPLLGIKEQDAITTGLTTEQTAHMGPNSFGLTIYVSLKNIINGGLE